MTDETAKPTPGPWMRDGTLIYALHHNPKHGFRRGEPELTNRFSARVSHDFSGAPESELEANARIMAAALNLLEALIECADCLSDVATGKGGWAWEEVLDTARAAIAEAKGDENEP